MMGIQLHPRWAFSLFAGIAMGITLFAYQNFTPSEPMSENPSTRLVRFGCHVAGDNRGCENQALCPHGYRPREAKAICNLEAIQLDPALLAGTDKNLLQVIRPSSEPQQGQCHVYSTHLREGTVEISELPKYSSALPFGCREYDEAKYGGGDCQILGEMVCEKFDGSLFVMEAKTNVRSSPDSPLQGLAFIDRENLLITQNPEGSGQLIFTLVNRAGDFIRDWRTDHAGHGQSLYIAKRSSAPDSSYLVLTETASGQGLSEFDLDSQLQTLTFVREIQAKLPDGKNLPVKTFGVRGLPGHKDALIAVSRVRSSHRTVQIFELDSFLNGTAKSVSNEFTLPEDPELDIGNQGVGLLANGFAVLTGNGALHSRKLVHRFSVEDGPNGKVIGRTSQVYRIVAGSSLAMQEGKYFEPEGIHIRGTDIYYSIISGTPAHRVKRIYRMSDDYFTNPSAAAP